MKIQITEEQYNRLKDGMDEKIHIDWDENYNKTFRIVQTPEGRQDRGEWTPDLISVVTPENGKSWYEWKDAPDHILRNWKKKWDYIQLSLGDNKYNQIIRSMKNPLN
jgi:hypothetical protein